MSLAIAAGLGLGGNESYPDLFQPYGGFPDNVEVQNGYVELPDLPGIGFEGKNDLIKQMKELTNWFNFKFFKKLMLDYLIYFLNYLEGFIIFSGLTILSKSFSEIKLYLTAASLSVKPSLWASLATFVALS